MLFRSKARLERIFNEQHDFIWRLLRRLGLSTEHADDAAQQVFLVAAERLGDIRKESERAFLFGTALRVARTVSRTERRMVLDNDMDLRRSQAPKAEELIDMRHAAKLMDGILGAMDIDLRAAFILFELEGMKISEIASLANVPIGTATSRLRRGREAFQASVARIEKSLRRQSRETKP